MATCCECGNASGRSSMREVRSRRRAQGLATAVLALLTAGLPCRAQLPVADHYSGMCEASAAVALDAQHFVVADDESNALRIYRRGASAPAGPPVELAAFLGTGDKASDLEGAALIGDVVYWISSHSLTSAGNNREWRRRLFATRADLPSSRPTVQPVGAPYVRLLEDLVDADERWSLGLARATQTPPEQAGGLNIEGLAATPDGGLLIGFRNPLKGRKAVVVPIQNPSAMMEGKKATFGVPALLDLGDRGIRSIERIATGYLIVAGPISNNGDFALYAWSGAPAEAAKPIRVALPPKFTPEALFVLPGTREALLLSDDGALLVGGKTCEKPDKSQQRFRATNITVQ